MSPRERARHQEKLLALKADILREGDFEIEPSRKGDGRAGESDDEQPLTEMNQVIASKRNRDRAGVLTRILAALQRLADHPEDFGQCTECGEPIGRRLELLPYVQLCVQCQQEKDGGRERGPRRHLRDFG